jgi:hypothetical protein
MAARLPDPIEGSISAGIFLEASKIITKTADTIGTTSPMSEVDVVVVVVIVVVVVVVEVVVVVVVVT